MCTPHTYCPLIHSIGHYHTCIAPLIHNIVHSHTRIASLIHLVHHYLNPQTKALDHRSIPSSYHFHLGPIECIYVYTTLVPYEFFSLAMNAKFIVLYFNTPSVKHSLTSKCYILTLQHNL